MRKRLDNMFVEQEGSDKALEGWAVPIVALSDVGATAILLESEPAEEGTENPRRLG